MRFLCAAFSAALLLAVAGPEARAEDQTSDRPALTQDHTDSFFARLREGGQVLVMRHGKSPHGQSAAVGMTEGCILGEGRGLSPAGFAEARSLGSFLADENVPILKAYTSDMCRSWDTARLVAGGAPVKPHSSQKTTDPGAVAKFKKQIEAELADNPGTSILLVSHSNIAPLYGAEVCEWEEELPEGGISVIMPEYWETVARILPDGGITSCAVGVD